MILSGVCPSNLVKVLGKAILHEHQFAQVTANENWDTIASAMGYPKENENIPFGLQQLYKKYLNAYELWQVSSLSVRTYLSKRNALECYRLDVQILACELVHSASHV